jgi:hypothetical protein
MKSKAPFLIVVMALASVSGAFSQDTCAKYSTLGFINCGGSQTTCRQTDSGVTGAVNCLCQAACLPGGAKIVQAQRGVRWGAGYACTGIVKGTATGGTMAPPTSTYETAVFATVNVEGVIITASGVYYSRQIDDCYTLGNVSDAQIAGFCI